MINILVNANTLPILIHVKLKFLALALLYFLFQLFCKTVFEIYNMGTKKINENLLNKYIETLRQIYSPYLSSIIVSMLNLQPKLRRRAS